MNTSKKIFTEKTLETFACTEKNRNFLSNNLSGKHPNVALAS